MVDIERSSYYKKGNKGINILNHLFRKRSKRNLNEMVKCLSSNSNDKLDQLLSKSMNNVNELNGGTEEQDNQTDQNYSLDNLEVTHHRLKTARDRQQTANRHQIIKDQLADYNEDCRRRLSTPIIVPMESLERKEPFRRKKLSLKMRRSFSPKSKLIIDQKKMSLDQDLLEHYNQLSTECNSSYISLVSNSPISPRVKSIDDDIEAITLSRQDNPFIQSKLERLSSYTGVDYDILSISNLSLNNGPFVNHCSTNTLNNLNQSNNSSHSNQSTHSNRFSQSNKTPSISSEELDEILNFTGRLTKEDNLHQHLIR